MVLIGVSSILIGLVAGYLLGFRSGLNMNKGQPSSLQTMSANPSNPALDLMFAEIVKELNCVCGCKMELQPCTCDEQKGSQEIRGFVRMLVQQGLSRPEIIKRLREKYNEGILIKKNLTIMNRTFNNTQIKEVLT